MVSVLRLSALTISVSLFVIPVCGQEIVNWPTPLFWGAPPEMSRDEVKTPQDLGKERLEASPTSPLPLIGIAPCRIVDTRGNGFTGPYGPPSLAASVPRNFTLTGQCGIAGTAQAVSLNITVTNTTGLGFISIYPQGGPAPLTSTLNYVAGQTVANAAVVILGSAGGITVVAGVSGTDVIIDTNGYYDNSGVITGITPGTGLMGGGTSGNVSLSIANGGVGTTQLSAAGSSNGQALVANGSAVFWGSPTSATNFTGNLGGEVTGTQGATVVSNATSANTGNAVVRRDGSGSFSAGTMTLSGNLALPASSSSTGSITQGGLSILHTFGTNNVFLGQVAGNFTMTGVSNTAAGAFALANNAGGLQNTAFGTAVLQQNTMGSTNTAVGVGALGTNTAGNNNIGIGFVAGTNITGSDNIDIGHPGVNTDSGTIRIGTNGTQTATFIAGISGATSSGGVPVYVNGSGQLGTSLSSRRFKRDIEDMRTASEGVMKLRPVTFRYRPEYDASALRQYGLIAEEVAEVYPDLVVYDEEGQPETVRYQFLVPMLLNEVQKEHRTIWEQRRSIEEQQRRIEKQAEAIENLTARLLRLEDLLGRQPIKDLMGAVGAYSPD